MQHLVGLVLFVLLWAACALDGPYVWVDELSAHDLAPAPYKVMPGDRLHVHVWNQTALSGEVLVRPDGKITLPLVGDVFVLGRAPPEIAVEIGQALGGLVREPKVAVALSGTRSPVVSVVGEVRTAGVFELRPGEGVLEVLARAGGLSEFANRNRVFVLRRSEGTRVRFDYDKLSRANGAGVRFLLRDGDVVIVE